MRAPTLEPLGDQALLLRWGDVADVAVNRRVHALAAALRADAPAWLVDCVPAYASLALFFDGASLPGNDPLAFVADWLATRSNVDAERVDAAASRVVAI